MQQDERAGLALQRHELLEVIRRGFRIKLNAKPTRLEAEALAQTLLVDA